MFQVLSKRINNVKLCYQYYQKYYNSFYINETITTVGPCVGATAELKHRFSQQDVNDFARLSGDNNPIHLDPDYASKTRFKSPIVHGVLVSGLISTLFGRVLSGTIYVKQTLNFRSPVHVDGNVLFSFDDSSTPNFPLCIDHK